MSDIIRPSYRDTIYSDKVETPTGSSLASELVGIDGVTASAAEVNKLAGCTATTAELNKLASCTATTAELNKLASCTATTSELNKLASCTSTTAELNLVDAAVASFTFTPAAGAANICEVTIQAKDAAGVSLNGPHIMTVWLSDAATGLGLTGTAASGTVTAKTATGAVFGTLEAKKALVVQTLANGSFVLEITDNAKTGFYVCAQSGLKKSISSALFAVKYGE